MTTWNTTKTYRPTKKQRVVLHMMGNAMAEIRQQVNGDAAWVKHYFHYSGLRSALRELATAPQRYGLDRLLEALVVCETQKEVIEWFKEYSFELDI